jgi:hypothetical protein
MRIVKFHFAFAHLIDVLLSLLPLNEKNGAKAKYQKLE